ncbi:MULTISPECIES: competence type IV pilus minor pilin ComGG [unclassified Streptococcus]|uniref:competence type IV pilus minor pilin ComGG n=2 Tax=Streptococcus TaxID=1301 RepID=UPI00107260C9|nr:MULTISPECIES: competence type IV pilus minor pilin ComGG [unclassified Streptococcus]MBF0786732.1 hypothetical protein [Streptococcus sp. 19428wC2_LYSM12]MCQ9211612.1 hypothetical protein [Streptococcus sp. B01]MCQ9213196.1 hypothetical protein [Streptococcus sp. O1]TFV06481.1 hypothetical protein E4T79_02175 [Streptococcus sp. LYSM12]
MLYATFMVAVFSLVLQFYLHAQISEARVVSANHESVEAHLIAEWTADIAREEMSSKIQMTKKSLRSSKMERELEAENVKNEAARKDIKVQGHLRFSKGQSHYQSDNHQLLVTVTTISGHEFFYSFPLPSKK